MVAISQLSPAGCSNTHTTDTLYNIQYSPPLGVGVAVFIINDREGDSLVALLIWPGGFSNVWPPMFCYFSFYQPSIALQCRK